jgi:hypothetical protein
VNQLWSIRNQILKIPTQKKQNTLHAQEHDTLIMIIQNIHKVLSTACTDL